MLGIDLQDSQAPEAQSAGELIFLQHVLNPGLSQENEVAKTAENYTQEQINFVRSNEDTLFISKFTMQVQIAGIQKIELIKSFVDRNPSVLNILSEAGISLNELDQVKDQILQQYQEQE